MSNLFCAVITIVISLNAFSQSFIGGETMKKSDAWTFDMLGKNTENLFFLGASYNYTKTIKVDNKPSLVTVGPSQTYSISLYSLKMNGDLIKQVQLPMSGSPIVAHGSGMLDGLPVIVYQASNSEILKVEQFSRDGKSLKSNEIGKMTDSLPTFVQFSLDQSQFTIAYKSSVHVYSTDLQIINSYAIPGVMKNIEPLKGLGSIVISELNNKLVITHISEGKSSQVHQISLDDYEVISEVAVKHDNNSRLIVSFLTGEINHDKIINRTGITLVNNTENRQLQRLHLLEFDIASHNITDQRIIPFKEEYISQAASNYKNPIGIAYLQITDIQFTDDDVYVLMEMKNGVKNVLSTNTTGIPQTRTSYSAYNMDIMLIRISSDGTVFQTFQKRDLSVSDVRKKYAGVLLHLEDDGPRLIYNIEPTVRYVAEIDSFDKTLKPQKQIQDSPWRKFKGYYCFNDVIKIDDERYFLLTKWGVRITPILLQF